MHAANGTLLCAGVVIHRVANDVYELTAATVADDGDEKGTSNAWVSFCIGLVGPEPYQ